MVEHMIKMQDDNEKVTAPEPGSAAGKIVNHRPSWEGDTRNSL